MYFYASMLSNGDGIEVNKEEAIKYYKIAIEKGNSDAMYNLALMFNEGDGVEVNKEEAIKYFKMASQKGKVNSMCILGYILSNDDGVEVNKEEGIKYYKISIEKGDTFAKYNYHLGQVFFRNPCEKREIRVFTSDTYANFEGKNATSLDEAHHYFASNAKNSWLVYDFRERKVHPTHYSIRSTNFGKNQGHPQNWVIEGSNSGQVNDWKIIDTRNNIKVLDEPNGRTYQTVNRFLTFEIQEKLDDNEFFRFLRIRQTGVSTRGDYIFEFSALEYFGTLLDLYSVCEYKRWNFQFRKFR